MTKARLGYPAGPSERAVPLERESFIVGGCWADQIAPTARLRGLTVEPICLGEQSSDLQVVRVGGDQALESLPRLSDIAVVEL